MSTNLTTTNYKQLNGQLFLDDISNANNTYYLFVGDNQNHSNLTLQSISSDSYDSYIYPWTNMIFGAQITASDVIPLVANYSYAANTIYAMYDDSDTNIINEQFFAITTEGSFYHVWKILDNNNESPSTIVPLFADLSGSNNVLYQTSDGYRWKYMTSIAESVANTFITPNYFPITSNIVTQAAAIPGSINIIKVLNGGQFYNNYTLGAFVSNDIRVNGDPTLYNLSNSNIITTNNYYTDCVLYITTGAAAGSYSTITNFVSNTTGNIIRIANAFPITPQNGDNYQINPQVFVYSVDNQQTINCIGRALVNSVNSNSVYRVEVLQPGAGYHNATANIVVSSVVGIANVATIDPIIPPPGGHGANCFSELFSNTYGMSVTLANTIGGTVPATNQYQQYGILRNPLFANVGFNLSSSTATFLVGEQISLIYPIQVAANCTTTVGNNIVVGYANSANFLNQFIPNAPVLITTANSSLAQLAFTNAALIANTLVLDLSSNMTFGSNTAKVWIPNITTNATVIAVINATAITVNNTLGIWQSNSIIIGQTSGALAFINNVSRNNTTKTFNTFVQMYKYTATLVSGTFIENETLNDSTSGATAILHSYTGSTTLTMYLSNFANGSFNVGDQFFGANGVATVVSLLQPELVYQSGDVLYVENISPVPRSNTQQETLNVLFNY